MPAHPPAPRPPSEGLPSGAAPLSCVTGAWGVWPGTGGVGRRPEEEAGAASHRLFHQTLAPMLEAAAEGGEPMGLLRQLKAVATGLGEDDAQVRPPPKTPPSPASGTDRCRLGASCTS